MSYFDVQKYFSYMSNMEKLPDVIYYPKLEIDYIHIIANITTSSCISSIPYSHPYDQHNFNLFISRVFKIASWFLCGCVLFYTADSFIFACSELIVCCCIYSLITHFQNTFSESYILYFISFNNFDNFIF